jgi:hypothetical protein
MRRRTNTVWVLLHGEIHLTLEGPRVDEAVMGTATSKAAALRLLRKTWIEPGTWWVLEQAGVNSVEGGRGRPLIYSPAATPLRQRPLDAAERMALVRLRKDIEGMRGVVRRTPPGKKKHRASLRSSLRYLRLVLRHYERA